MQVCGVAVFLAGYLKVHSFSYQAAQAHSAVVCFHTSMHSSHSSPPAWMKISWLPERGHWTFPQYSQPEKRKGRRGGGKGFSEENVWVYSAISFNRADNKT